MDTAKSIEIILFVLTAIISPISITTIIIVNAYSGVIIKSPLILKLDLIYGNLIVKANRTY